METQYNKNGDPRGQNDLTVDAIKQEILDNCGENTLLILPEAKRLTTSIRYWLEDMISAEDVLKALTKLALGKLQGG